MGIPMAIDVHSANPHDSNCAKPVLANLKKIFPRLQVVIGDSGYQGDIQKWFFRHTKGCLLSIIKRSDKPHFNVQPKRWIVERTFAWLKYFRRLSRDFEVTTSSSKAFLTLAAIKFALNYIT